MSLDPVLIQFLLTVVLSFLVGMEIRTYMQQYHGGNDPAFFGSVRTFTLVGISGFILYSIDTARLLPYTAGLISITLLYALFYWKKLETGRKSILAYVVLLVVYGFGPLAALYPLWMPTLNQYPASPPPAQRF